MSYTVTCDGLPLIDYADEACRLYETHWHPETDKAGTFQFTIYPNHPNVNAVKRMKSVIRIYSDGVLVFQGRPLDDDSGWYNQGTFLCEGDLAMLNDSIQRPFCFPVDDSHTTPGDYLEFLVARHNSQMPPEKQFTVGTVTVADANDYIARSDTEYSTTWELIQEGLLNTVGGHIVLRIEGNTRFIDYLVDFEQLSSQPIIFGENLLDILTQRKGADLATAILPLGAVNEETGERLTIQSLDDSETDDICKEGDIVYSKAAEAVYGGRIIKALPWDDVTVPLNLLRKARAELQIRRQVASTQQLTAADMAAAGYNVEPWMINRYVYVTDEPHKDVHDLQPYYLITAMDINLMDPSQNTVTVGAVNKTFTAQTTERVNKMMGELIVADQRNREAVADALEQVARIDSQIELTNEAVAQYYQYILGVDSRVVDIEAYVKTGHILDDASGKPIFGVLIGQQDLAGAFKSAFTASMLAFFEAEELVAFFSNRKLNVETVRTANLELTDDLEDQEAVDWQITLSNGFTLRWIGS